jgi:AGCS family alanine or glycine:cation symporter
MLDQIIHAVNAFFLTPIYGIPFLIIWLVGCSIYLTLQLNFINITQVGRAIKMMFSKQKQIVDGTNGEKIVQISSVTAFLSQAAGTLGIGNISGAAFALHSGGPGIVIWVVISSFFFSIIKFAEITLGKLYRHIDANGTVSGGSFYFIRDGLSKRIKNKAFIKYFATTAAVITFIVPFGWSSLQINQITNVVLKGKELFDPITQSINYDVLLTSTAIMLLVFIILIGGISRIGHVANVIVPFMAGGYIIMCICVIFTHFANFQNTVAIIIDSAFNVKTAASGIILSIVVSMQRMIFASEAGVATSSIVHANSNVKFAAQQGYVALFDCLMISLVIAFGAFAVVISGVDYTSTTNVGILLMHDAFITVHSGFSYALILVAFLFGTTTITGNGYSVQKACGYIFGTKQEKKYIIFYVVIVLALSFHPSRSLVAIADALGMLILIPNLTAVILLSGDVKKQLKIYLTNR